MSGRSSGPSCGILRFRPNQANRISNPTHHAGNFPGPVVRYLDRLRRMAREVEADHVSRLRWLRHRSRFCSLDFDTDQAATADASNRFLEVGQPRLHNLLVSDALGVFQLTRCPPSSRWSRLVAQGTEVVLGLDLRPCRPRFITRCWRQPFEL